ncbi:MAG: hypothetical protein A2Z88_03955 [Omnitrophica WOR_2 bacterium GWA2_47_8]|nr:MAG: hypothetical protein A2Z88_03955 [Omnitrophica WOR_2 bacterium GWA2_47_8]
MLTKKEKSVVLVQGVVKGSLFDLLKKRKTTDIVVLEGRPNLEAARQSTKDLAKRKLIPTLIADNMAGVLFYKNLVKEVWLSYQLTDENGALCDIGGLILAVLGKRHNIPVYIYPSGRKSKLLGVSGDILKFNGTRVAPAGVEGYVPLVEWVPQKYITKTYE